MAKNTSEQDELIKRLQTDFDEIESHVQTKIEEFADDSKKIARVEEQIKSMDARLRQAERAVAVNRKTLAGVHQTVQRMLMREQVTTAKRDLAFMFAERVGWLIFAGLALFLGADGKQLIEIALKVFGG